MNLRSCSLHGFEITITKKLHPIAQNSDSTYFNIFIYNIMRFYSHTGSHFNKEGAHFSQRGNKYC